MLQVYAASINKGQPIFDASKSKCIKLTFSPSNKIELQDYEVVICYKHENETIIFSLVSIIRSMSYQDSKY